MAWEGVAFRRGSFLFVEVWVGERRVNGRVLAVLAAWVTLRLFSLNDDLDRAMGFQLFYAEALAAAFVSLPVLGWALIRRQGRLGVRQWVALLLLSGATAAGGLLWAPYVDTLLGLRAARGAHPMMIQMVAPLWLALLGALRLVPEMTPRRTVGAALLGLAGYCLLLRADDMSVGLAEWPVLLLWLLQAIGLVWTWSFARRALSGWALPIIVGSAMVCAGLVNGALGYAARPLVAMQETQPIDWPSTWKVLPLGVLERGVAAFLWFWLLEHVELAAFSAQSLLVALGMVVTGLVAFGFLSWRYDVALVLLAGAVWTALRARVEDDEPVRLGVVGPGLR